MGEIYMSSGYFLYPKRARMTHGICKVRSFVAGDILDSSRETLVFLWVIVLEPDLELHCLEESLLVDLGIVQDSIDTLVQSVTRYFGSGREWLWQWESFTSKVINASWHSIPLPEEWMRMFTLKEDFQCKKMTGNGHTALVNFIPSWLFSARNIRLGKK